MKNHPEPDVESSDTSDRAEVVDWSTAGYQGLTGFDATRSYNNLSATTKVLVQPAPVTRPRRRKLLLGAILVIGCMIGAHRVWHAFFRYRALGNVIGQMIEVSAPHDGVVQSMHVKVGEKVQKGEVLLTLDYPAVQARISQLSDEIRVAQADVSAETSRLKWQYMVSENGSYKLVADYHEKMGVLLAEQARLEDLMLTLQRIQVLRRRKVATEQAFDKARLAERGQREKVRKLKEAVAKLKQRAEAVTSSADDGRAQLEAKHSRVEALLAEIARLRQRIVAGQIRAPGGGIVVKQFHFPGEYVVHHEPLLSILKMDSLEVVLYMPHCDSGFLAPDQQIDVEVEPHSEPVLLRISRLGDELVSPPEQLQTYYRRHEKLLPVYLKPVANSSQPLALRVGGIARLPYGASPRPMRDHP